MNAFNLSVNNGCFESETIQSAQNLLSHKAVKYFSVIVINSNTIQLNHRNIAYNKTHIREVTVKKS